MNTTQELAERHKLACDLKQRVNREAIVDALTRFQNGITQSPVPVSFVVTEGDFKKIARDAWAARDARAARDAWAARAARDAWAAWAARDAWAARAARDAWAAWAARDARAAWAARDAWDAWAWELSWVSITAIGAAEQSAQNRNDGSLLRCWLPLLEAFEAGAFCILFTADTLAVAEIPSVVALDDRRRLHHVAGPAFAWLEDIRDYYWHGVHVPDYVVERPSQITVKGIEAEKNAEVRRVMIERFGQDRYLLESHAEKIHEDEFGVLYRKEIPDDEPLVMVKVVNSTPEPDGSFKDYFLRVPPTMGTARQAVAWTFEKEEQEYAPLIET